MAGARAGDGRLSPEARKQLAHIRACEESGETLKSYAERHGLRVHSLYHAKKLAREHGILPPHRKQKGSSQVPRGSQPPRFVEAVRRADVGEGAVSWRVRFPGGELLESTRPLSFDETLRLIETLGA